MSHAKTDLRKSLKSLYDDLVEAENGPDRVTFGFKHRLKVIHEELQYLESRLYAEFPHLGDFGTIGDFDSQHYQRGDSGMDQLLKSHIKRLVIEIEADPEQDALENSEEILSPEKISEIISSLDTLIDIFSNSRTRQKGLNTAIEQYDISWNIAKKKFPNRNDIELLKINKVTIPKLLLLGEGELALQREPLVAKAKRLKNIFKESKSKKIQINLPNTNISNNIISEDNETLLHIEPQLQKSKVDVFISHRFVKSDIELAAILQKTLSEKNIDAYLAERQREYGKHLSEKIKENIEKSKCLVAIITENSKNAPSVHQEIGYALGFRIPVIILAEEDEAPGVLVKGVETELFKRKDFEKHCKIVFEHIPISDKNIIPDNNEKRELNEKIYGPCYDEIVNLLEKNKFIKDVPKNPWSVISPAWRLRADPEIKALFNKFDQELEIWRKMFVSFENDFFHQSHKISDTITPAFEAAALMISPKEIYLDDRHTMQLERWVHEFRFILFDPSITNSSLLHKKLIEFSRITNNGHESWLNQFSAKNDLFNYIIKVLPVVKEEFQTEIDMNEFNGQREKLLGITDNLKSVLEKKLNL